MKKVIVLLAFVISAASFVNAQDYSTGIGVRGGLSNGVTLKQFIGDKVAVEGILSSRWRGFDITALYEIHKMTAFDVERLNWYYGVGGHLGFWNGDNVSWATDSNDYLVIGIDGILGIEYNFEEIPINISVDWKPAMNLIGYTGFWGDGGALSLRYIF